jgi:hypothetical protein
MVKGRDMELELVRCLVPEFDGALSMQEWKDALWAKFFTGAPARQRQSVEQYKNFSKKYKPSLTKLNRREAISFLPPALA